jgi:hypothetical protein
MERPVKIDREWGDPDRGGTASTEVKTSLTLIGPGEVKVDLANFDLKLQENLLSTLYIIFLPIPAETFSGSF